MVKYKKDLNVHTTSCLKDGNGKIKVIDILSQKELANNGRLYAVTIIPPGASIGPHVHSGDYETYFITKGIAEVNDNGVLRELGPGDVLVCEDGSFHSVRNTGSEDLEYIALILYSEKNASSQIDDVSNPIKG